MTNNTTSAIQVAAPQSDKAGPDRDRRNKLEGEIVEDVEELNPIGRLDGLLTENAKGHDGQTAHPGSNLYPTGPGGARQDVGGDVNSKELTDDLAEEKRIVAAVSVAEALVMPKDELSAPNKK